MRLGFPRELDLLVRISRANSGGGLKSFTSRMKNVLSEED